MNCEHCNIETEGARDDQGRVWPICGECLREMLLRCGIERATNDKETKR